MKSATFLLLLCSVTAYAGPVSLLHDGRYRDSDGFAQYNSTSSYLNGHQSIGWHMTANTPFGGMDGYDLNEIPLGFYNGGSGTYIGGMVGMTSTFGDGVIHGSGFTSNYLGIATSGPHAQAGDSGYARLEMQSHYEITFQVNETIYYDLSGSLLGGSLLSLTSSDGYTLLGADTFNYSGVLNSGVYTILAEACTALEQSMEGETREQKGYAFNLSYRPVPDGGASVLLVGLGITGALSIVAIRRRGIRSRA